MWPNAIFVLFDAIVKSNVLSPNNVYYTMYIRSYVSHAHVVSFVHFLSVKDHIYGPSLPPIENPIHTGGGTSSCKVPDQHGQSFSSV